jgi:hypothetical protein
VKDKQWHAARVATISLDPTPGILELPGRGGGGILKIFFYKNILKNKIYYK